MFVYTQDISVWTVTRGVTGGPTYSGPTVIKGRWEDRQENFIDSKGANVVSRAVAFLASDVDPGCWLAPGDRTGTADPSGLSDAFPVAQFSKIPDLRHIEYERTAHM